MDKITVGQKIHVRINRIKRIPEIVEAEVVEIQTRYIICRYFGKNHKFYKNNLKQVTGGNFPAELIPNIAEYNKKLQEEQIYKDVERMLLNVSRYNRAHIPSKLKKLSLDEIKALKYLLQKIS